MNRPSLACRSFPGGVRPGQVLVEGIVEKGRGEHQCPTQGWSRGGPQRGAAGNQALHLEAGLVGTEDM